MTLQLQTIDEAIDQTGIKACVFGPAGAGKTYLISTILQPTIVLSAEAGLLSLKNVSQEVKDLTRVLQIKTWQDMDQALAWLQSAKQADWLVVDSISEIAEVLLSVKKGENKDPRKAYGDMADDMMKTIRDLRDLPNYNVLMTAKQTRLTDEVTNITSYVPFLPGQQLGKQIPYMFDEMFALRVENDPNNPGELYRVLQTGRDLMYECKDRSGTLDMFEPANIEHIANKINVT